MQVFIIAAITTDGFIAQTTNQLADWTSKEDKRLFVDKTKAAGVMVMGETTFTTIGRGLPGRKTFVYSHQPEQFKDVEGDVEFTNLEPSKLIDQLKAEGHEAVAICGGSQTYTMFLQSGLVTDLFLSVEPIVFGQGVSLFNQALVGHLELVENRPLNENVFLLHYRTRQ